jgi:hypothetical protein
MPNSSSYGGLRFSSIAAILLIILITPGDKAISAQLFFPPDPSSSHNSRNSPLYDRDTVLLNNRDLPGAGFIRRERNGDLVIMVPNPGREKYRIRFFDDDNNFLFEVRQIRDPLLIVEKYNFQHAGMFHYELYRESLLIERSTFLIRKD